MYYATVAGRSYVSALCLLQSLRGLEKTSVIKPPPGPQAWLKESSYVPLKQQLHQNLCSRFLVLTDSIYTSWDWRRGVVGWSVMSTIGPNLCSSIYHPTLAFYTIIACSTTSDRFKFFHTRHFSIFDSVYISDIAV